VGGVAEAGHGRGGGLDLLSTRSGNAGGIGTTEVVHDHGVRPIGLDRGVTVVHTLIQRTRSVLLYKLGKRKKAKVETKYVLKFVTHLVAANADRHVGNLIVIEPGLSNIVARDVEGTCLKSLFSKRNMCKCR
jgi:hypothetical protein